MNKMPADFDLIAGIPRCGMIPATLLAMYWNLPLTDVHSLAAGKLYPNLVQDKWDIKKTKKVLVVDDTIATGRNLKKIKALLSGLNYEFKYAAVYATNIARKHVNYYGELVAHPRTFEWDLTLSTQIRDSCCDIDGVLCRNPTREEQSTPEKLSYFYRTVTPWLKPPFIDKLVTGRLEKYRPDTEAWLKKHGIEYNELIMISEQGDKGKFKAQVYRKANNLIFIESSPKEAEIIKGTNKQVLVPFQERQKINILAHVLPTRKPAGATITICTVSSALNGKYSVKISQPPTEIPFMPESMHSLMVDGDIGRMYRDAEAVLVHWRASRKALPLSEKYKKPRIHFFCDGGTWQRMGIKDAALVVYNSCWLMNSDGWPGDKMVIYPPVYPERFKTEKGDGILLVSPIYTKGVDLFIELAKRMPDRKFVIAEGRGRPIRVPDNVEIIKQVDDPREIYSKARLALMPSREGKMLLGGQKMTTWVEGYGRVAIEAAASGIPTIASRESVGLNECLGPEGMFAGQDNIEEWVELIEKLDNKDFYQEKSEHALELSRQRHPDKQINELEERLVDICNRL